MIDRITEAAGPRRADDGASMTWYTVVGFGGTGGCPHGPWSDAGDAADAIRRWMQRAQHTAGDRIARHVLRVLAYGTRQQARDGDISHGLGEAGCVGMWSLGDFARSEQANLRAVRGG